MTKGRTLHVIKNYFRSQPKVQVNEKEAISEFDSTQNVINREHASNIQYSKIDLSTIVTPLEKTRGGLLKKQRIWKILVKPKSQNSRNFSLIFDNFYYLSLNKIMFISTVKVKSQSITSEYRVNPKQTNTPPPFPPYELKY